jgi:prepilin-type N-terminal cleavage/methylation domain-containing protein
MRKQVMTCSSQRRQSGFTLVELLIATAVTVTVVGGAVLLFAHSVQTSNFSLKHSEVQTEARAALTQISRDLSQAGTGVPLNGVAIPSVSTGGADPNFACDATQCYTANDPAFTQGLLYKVTPGKGVGPNISEPSDGIKVTYVDPTLDWSSFQAAIIAADGSSLTMPLATVPAVTDPAVGVTPGDVILLQNAYGSAVGVVTAVAGQAITFGVDPLNINQPAAAAGNIRSLATPGSNPVVFPPTQVSRLVMATYFIQSFVGPSGPDARLMRQSGAHPPVPVAEHIEDLKFTYDVIDPVSNALTANSPDTVIGTPAVPQPNQIRKININVTSKAFRADMPGAQNNQRVNLTTSIGPRNLSFRDRYQ